MNRIIKFRAWIIGEKKMMHDYECLSFEPSHPHPLIQYADQGFYTNNAMAEGYHLENLKKHNIKPVDEFIIMQFTGLYDKNGKEVYHKDFIKSGKKIYLVEWQKEEARFFLSPIKGTYQWQFMDMADSFEVIGNVYENPELLK